MFKNQMKPNPTGNPALDLWIEQNEKMHRQIMDAIKRVDSLIDQASQQLDAQEKVTSTVRAGKTIEV